MSRRRNVTAIVEPPKPPRIKTMDLRDVSTFGVLIEKLNNYMTAAKSHGLEDEQAEELIKNNM